MLTGALRLCHNQSISNFERGYFVCGHFLCIHSQISHITEIGETNWLINSMEQHFFLFRSYDELDSQKNIRKLEFNMMRRCLNDVIINETQNTSKPALLYCCGLASLNSHLLYLFLICSGTEYIKAKRILFVWLIQLNSCRRYIV